ncbi:hypothetical protein AB1Y20_019534 [Prymnesium parvum]|uniref:PDZ domain-containing protein n=1 Tax=Prymnesium parvum TaxID=97485 RepID=A0AB34JUE2_PRYPA
MPPGLEENIILDLEEEDPVLVEWHKSSLDERLGVVFFTSRTRVVVDLVESGSPADELGIYPGQQLLSVNGTMVKSAERAIKLLSTRAKVVQLKLVQPAPKARAGNTVKTVVWAVSWMMINYRRDFIACLLLMAYNIVVISTLPILKQFLFETALPRFLTSGIDLCLIDMITTLVIIGVTTLLHCQTQYMLDLNKMDGAGFVPLMQRRLTMHITTLPQRILDQANEIALLAMIQEDVVVLDRVISAFFDLTIGSLTLLCLLPILATLSGELTCIIALAVPVFLSMQLRLGAFTAKAAEMLRDAEALFMRLIEENLVYARTKARAYVVPHQCFENRAIEYLSSFLAPSETAWFGAVDE